MNQESGESDAPLIAPILRVPAEWIDYNGHMNVAYYVLAFDQAVDYLLAQLDLGEAYAASGEGTSFTLQSHVQYLAEVGLGDPLKISVHLLDHDQKRLHYFMQMHHAEENYLSATCEQVAVHVDLSTRRSSAFPKNALANIERMAAAHADLERSDRIGREIGLVRR